MHSSKVVLQDVDLESEVFTFSGEVAEIDFAQKFSSQNGKFIFCETESELYENLRMLKNDFGIKTIHCPDKNILPMLDKMSLIVSPSETELMTNKASIIGCEMLVARTGSVVVSSEHLLATGSFFSAGIQIIIAFTSQLVYSMKESLNKLKVKYGELLPSSIIIFGGNTLGQDAEFFNKTSKSTKEIFLFLVDDNPVS